MSAMTAQSIDQLVRFYQPIFYLHPDEEYMPINFTRYVNESRLKNVKTGTDVILQNALGRPFSQVFGEALLHFPEYNTTDYTLYLPRGMDSEVMKRNQLLEEDINNVPLYVYTRVVPKEDFSQQVIISYAHMYAYNGPLAICQCQKFKVGAHYADLEHVTLIVTVDARGNHALTKLYTSRHSGGVWLDPQELLYDKNRPIIFSALNSHASYNTTGKHKRFWGFVSDDCGYGTKWDARQIVKIPKDTPLDRVDPISRWMLFNGQLGDGGVDSFIRKGWLREIDVEENYGQGCCFKC